VDAGPGQLDLTFDVAGASPRELEELTAAVRRELLQLDVASVERPPAGPVPTGARGVDLAAIGALVVNLGQAAPVLGQVVEAIRAWVARDPSRTVKRTIDGDTLELTGISEHDQHQVIRDWMARHPRPRPNSRDRHGRRPQRPDRRHQRVRGRALAPLQGPASDAEAPRRSSPRRRSAASTSAWP
jgi:hypothetical protein